MSIPVPLSVDDVVELLSGGDYVADRALATVLFLALTLKRPLLLEGDAGTGKTEIARVLATRLGRRLIRLQCFDGLDIAAAAYEWNYARQMLEIRLAETTPAGRADVARDLFDRRFLTARPLLQALEPDPAGPPVLLIDELDRTDEPFEAYLLELLSDFQITIPELGTISAASPPIVILTSNRTREIHDALKRRCLYHWVGYPDAAREAAILALKAPQASAALRRQIVSFVRQARDLTLFKPPGIAETIDWAAALVALDALALDPAIVSASLGALLKYQDDIARFDAETTSRMVVEAIA